MTKFDINHKVRFSNDKIGQFRGRVVLIYGEPKRFLVKWQRWDDLAWGWVEDGEQAHNERELQGGWA